MSEPTQEEMENVCICENFPNTSCKVCFPSKPATPQPESVRCKCGHARSEHALYEGVQGDGLCCNDRCDCEGFLLPWDEPLPTPHLGERKFPTGGDPDSWCVCGHHELNHANYSRLPHACNQTGCECVEFRKAQPGERETPTVPSNFCVIKEPDNPDFSEKFECREWGENFITMCSYTRLKLRIAELESKLSALPVAEPNGVGLIAAERARQVAVEGWTPEHDDTHTVGQMIVAAQDYIGAAKDIMRRWDFPTKPYGGWPWDESWWKPSSDPIRNLVKAGALIAAEIDRLQRIAPPTERSSTP